MKSLLSWTLALVLLTAGQALAQPVAATAQGQVRGAVTADVDQFLGIPYAAPPVGELRWKPPAPAAAWTEVRDGSKMATQCSAQANGDGPRVANEDCLYLNLYRPAVMQRGVRLPVMVFLHGGGNLWGSPNVYDGGRMARVGQAVVVTPAFRLGVFGSLALPGEGAGGGAYTVQDQIAALQWVQRNIAAFGGDPSDVTVLGQSAGGGNVCGLLAALGAQGLYHQAIIQSSACGARPKLVQAQDWAREFGAALSCMPDGLAACLRAADAGKVLDGWKNSGASPSGGAVLPVDPGQALNDGRFYRVPLLIGFARDEQWPYQHGLYPLSQAGFDAKLAERYGERAAQVAALYPPSKFPHIEYALGAAAGDAGVVCSSFVSARNAARFAPVYAYEFADRTTPPFKSLGPPQAIPPGYEPGAFQTSELQFILGYKAAMRPLDEAQQARGDAMIR